MLDYSLLVIACLALQAMAVRGPSSPSKGSLSRPAPQHGPYAASSPRISKKYSNARLYQLGFLYDPNNHTPKEQTRHISSHLNRALHCHPDEMREVKQSGPKISTHDIYRDTNESNAEYVDRLRTQHNAKQRLQRKNEAEKRYEALERTGDLPSTQHARLVRERLARIRSSNPNDIAMFKTGKGGALEPDKHGRTNLQYMEHLTRRSRQGNMRARDRKKGGGVTNVVSVKNVPSLVSSEIQNSARNQESAQQSSPFQHTQPTSTTFMPTSPVSSTGSIPWSALSPIGSLD